MTKEELIEELSKRRFGLGFGFGWDALSDHGKEQYRAMVREDWPLIVEFVAQFLEDSSPGDFATNISEPNTVSRVWREEMT